MNCISQADRIAGTHTNITSVDLSSCFEGGWVFYPMLSYTLYILQFLFH